MTTIPSGGAARDAWAVLPEADRAEVRRLAERDQGHPDPRIAAVAVGWARVAQRWPWWRTAMLGLGLCLFAGEILALYALGGSFPFAARDGGDVGANVRGWVVLVAPGVAGIAMAVAVARLRAADALPRGAEVANLRTFLASHEASAGGPVQRSRPGITPRQAAVAIVMVVGTAAVTAVALLVMRTPLRIGRGVDSFVIGVVMALVLFVGRPLLRRFRQRGGRARYVRVEEAGLRFDRRAPIPWSDVIGVRLSGPTDQHPGDDGVIVWSVRGDPPTVATPLHSGPLPEELILAARTRVAANQAA